ncbi:hypothetical protein GIB67_012498 [Kingdonia uniflora]|uniref:GPI inositol-deacylase n=1 Tax=Kingdonia uniflora TaxID=39325 RepID=A0A7J7MVC2_9MAGN|nr:hypothetical protein GIB67_012498 [Kingdonia uniflora]
MGFGMVGVSTPFPISIFLTPTTTLQQPLNKHFSIGVTTEASLSKTKPRPAVILPGLGNNSSDYEKLGVTLQGYGVSIVVPKVSRIDWLRNAAGLLDGNYWRGTLSPRPVLDWYLERVDEAVREAMLMTEGESLSLIGHSAGGWLARVYMEEFGNSSISLLLTLGSPLMPPSKDLPGVIDQTRGLLNYVERSCAKAVYTPELKYVCIAGRYIQGERFFGNSNSLVPIDSEQPVTEVAVMNNTNQSRSVSTVARARFIGQGYKQVCGQADVWGDGVVPEVSSHLQGALNITLDGVYHSPVGSDDTQRPWYGSPAVVDKWVHHLLS